MALDDKQLLELGRGRDGSLGAVPFPVLLCALHRAERSGVLELTQKNLVKRIALEEGVPVSCDSNLMHESPARFLVEKGKLDEAGYQKVLTESAVAGERAEQTLLRLKLIAPFEFFKLLQQNLALKILDCFCAAWSGARWRLHADAPPVAQPLRVNLPQLVYTGVGTFAPMDAVERGLCELAGKRLALVPEPPHPLKSLKLGARDARLLSELKRGASLDELCSAAKAARQDVLRKAYALHVLGYVDLEDRARAQAAALAAKAAAASQPAPVAPAPAPAASAPTAAAGPSPQELARSRDEVTAAYLRYRAQDPLELFGLDERSSATQIRDAWLAWAERFAPWGFTHPELAPLAEKARDLFLFGARAFAELADTERRAQVLSRRAAAKAAAQRKRGPDFSIQTDLLDARKQHDEGMRKLAAGDARGAVAFLEFASDCEPRNATYLSHLAYARFLANPQSASARLALSDLAEAERIDPECAEAHYLTGEILRWAGDLDHAEESYRRASKLAPGDRRPVEALKGLVLARKKA